MSFALVLKKTSWYRRRYSRPIRVKVPCDDRGSVRVFVDVAA